MAYFAAGQSLDMAIDKLLNEIGTHILRVGVEYKDRDSGETRALRKVYGFKVTSPIHVSLKHVNIRGLAPPPAAPAADAADAEDSSSSSSSNSNNNKYSSGGAAGGSGGVSFVEASLRSLATQPIVLENVSLLPTAFFEVTDLSPRSLAPGPAPPVAGGGAAAAGAAAAAGSAAETEGADDSGGAAAARDRTLDDLCARAGVAVGTFVRTRAGPGGAGTSISMDSELVLQQPLAALNSSSSSTPGSSSGGGGGGGGDGGGRISICLKPNEKQQFLFRVVRKQQAGQQQGQPPSAADETSMGRINIVWRAHMGEMGRLQTAAVKRDPPPAAEVTVTATQRPGSQTAAGSGGGGGGGGGGGPSSPALQAVPLWTAAVPVAGVAADQTGSAADAITAAAATAQQQLQPRLMVQGRREPLYIIVRNHSKVHARLLQLAVRAERTAGIQPDGLSRQVRTLVNPGRQTVAVAAGA